MVESINTQGRRLAFVIPAFKGRFLRYTLESLAEQTYQDFGVYIGDDASPDDLKRIVSPYQDRMNLHYQRFDYNLGSKSLAKHWERCVGLSSEPFFCLLGDDDLLDRNCVADLHIALKKSNEKYDVYRFNNAVIDDRGELIAYGAPSTRLESHKAFLYSRLQHGRISFMSSYVIHRRAYIRERGFVDFPLAWFSDDASIITFSRLTGICNIVGQRVYWRLSAENISSVNKNSYKKKIDASVRYLKWLVDRFGWDAIVEDSLHSKELRILIERWFFRHLDYAGCYPLGILKLLSISAAISPYCKSNMVNLFLKLNSHIRRKSRLTQGAVSELSKDSK